MIYIQNEKSGYVVRNRIQKDIFERKASNQKSTDTSVQTGSSESGEQELDLQCPESSLLAVKMDKSHIYNSHYNSHSDLTYEFHIPTVTDFPGEIQRVT